MRNILKKVSHHEELKSGSAVPKKKSDSTNIAISVIAVLIGTALLVYVVSGFEIKKSGVSDGESVVSDPPGTVTTSLRVYNKGNAAINFETGGTSVQMSRYEDMYLDTNVNFNTYGGRGAVGTSWIVDVGWVSGVGAITSVPTSGWVRTCSAVVGHGYVIETQEGNYYRFYVKSEIISATTGGVIGVNIKWAPL